MNPEALVRLFPFSVGQPVQIKEDPTTVANISQQYGNPTARDVKYPWLILLAIQHLLVGYLCPVMHKNE